MRLSMQSPELSIIVDTLGGELQSIRDKEGTEYLWQGDAHYWSEKAPHLFPYIARLTDGTYQYRGKKYAMGIHGFIWTSRLHPVLVQPGRILLQFVSNGSTQKIYPFDFTYEIEYQLRGNVLDITYRVRNTGNPCMYFGIGGHPGFRVPIDQETCFEDYELRFGKPCRPEQILFSEDCFVTGETRYFPLAENKIRLKHTLFDHDAIVLKNMADTVTLSGKNSRHYVKIQYPQMNYLGLWHTPRSKAPYICIEPWSSLPSRKGIVEDLETQEDLVRLEKNALYCNRWSITCGIKQ